MAAILGKRMRALVIESIEERLEKAGYPNTKTVKAIKKIERNKDLVEAKNAQDLFKKLGI